MFDKTLICLDGSKLSEEVIDYAIKYCLGCGCEAILLMVITAHITIPPPQSTHVITIGPNSKPDQIHTTDIGKSTTLEPKAGLQLREIEREQAEANIYLDNIARQFLAKDIKVETVTLQGDIDETILNYANKRKVSLIALTTHGSGDFKRGLLGRVAQFILKKSAIPVMIIKP
jgi:nucleotide-binding universal stress UspA family protein